MKPDRLLVDRYADQIGRIDATAFRAFARFRMPVWVGQHDPADRRRGGSGRGDRGPLPVSSETLAGLLLIAAGVIWTVALHCPTHWLVGYMVSIRFTDYFVGGPPPPRPGLKSDYASYLKADPGSRAWMHASGAIASKLAPFLALAFWPGSGAPWWSAAALIAIGVLTIVTDITLSVTKSDWKKFKRERAVAKARASVGAAPVRMARLYSPPNHRGARGYRAERPAPCRRRPE